MVERSDAMLHPRIRRASRVYAPRIMLQRDCLILRQLFDRTSCTYTYLLG